MSLRLWGADLGLANDELALHKGMVCQVVVVEVLGLPITMFHAVGYASVHRLQLPNQG